MLLKRKEEIFDDIKSIVDKALDFNNINTISKIINSVEIDNDKNLYIYYNFKDLKWIN